MVSLLGEIFDEFKYFRFIVHLYIYKKQSVLKRQKLDSNDYCLCIEIPFKAKLFKLKYSTFPCIERKRFADKKKLKHLKMVLKFLNIFSKYLKYHQFK